MANLVYSQILIRVVLLVFFVDISSATTANNESNVNVADGIKKSLTMMSHNGPLLNGKIGINLIWYGNFSSAQQSIVKDFITSLYTPSRTISDQPDVVTWWKMIEKYYDPSLKKAKKADKLTLSLGTQINDDKYSLGKKLANSQILQLGSKGAQRDAINVILTSADVVVDGFCARCGLHWSAKGSEIVKLGMKSKYAYIWVGNLETQCPGQCAWPFHQPISGPKTKPLESPNNDAGIDGMIINLASLLAATATNPFGDGYYEGPKEAPLEAASACPGIFARGAYPGYPGNLLVDSKTAVSYNAQGVNGRKFLLPAIFDPKSQVCKTLV